MAFRASQDGGGGGRAAKRLSRVTPSEFDQLLASGTTKSMHVRDERYLGKSTLSNIDSSPKRSSSPTRSFSASPSTRRPSAVPTTSDASYDESETESLAASTSSSAIAWKGGPSEQAAGSDNSRRSSLLGGTRKASSPDLASEAKLDRPGKQDSPKSPPAISPAPPTRQRAPIPFQLHTSPTLTPSPSGSNGTNLAPASKGKSRVSEVSIGTVDSYVHVPPAGVNDEQSRPAVYETNSNRSTARLGTMDFSPKKVRGTRGDNESSKSQGTTFSNTMRKTSRFFRKLGGSSSPPSSSVSTKPKGYTSSAPNTPIAAEFGQISQPKQSSVAPPVPPIPLGYTTPNSQSPVIAESDPGSQPAYSEPPVPKSITVDRDLSSSSLQVKQARRRSTSLGSSSGGTYIPNVATNGESLSRGRDDTSSKSMGSDEGDQLRSELLRWQLTQDGVLGSTPSHSNLAPSPSMHSMTDTQSASAPTTPASSTKGKAVAKNGRPLSTPSPSAVSFQAVEGRRRQASLDASVADIAPLVSPRSGSLPTPALFSSTPSTPPTASSTRSSSSPPPPALPASPAHLTETTSTPSIRLVSPKSTASDLREHVESLPARNPSLSLDGLGLQTISESPQRDASPSSFSTPVRSRLGLSGTSTQPPVVVTQSPSPMATPEASRRALARQSVVSYPSTRPSISTKVSSTSSLHSEGPGSAATRSQNETSSAGDGASQAEAPIEEEKGRNFAQRCWDEDPTFLEPRKIAEWLGSTGRLNGAALRSYIDLFDFTDLRLDMAFRRLCDKLYLKAETQQVDRILEQFSRRYYETNPRCVYPSPDVVHAVAYSLLLLNTDLHVVDTTMRMSRPQFIRNTVEAINAQREGVIDSTPAMLFGSTSQTDEPDNVSVFGGPEGASSSVKSFEKTLPATTRRSGSLHQWNPSAKDSPVPSFNNLPRTPERSRPSTATATSSVENSPARERESSNQSGRLYDLELEANLKEMYTAIKAQPIFQRQDSESRSSLSAIPTNSPYGTWHGANRAGNRRSGISTNGSTSSTAFKRSSVRGFGSFLSASSTEHGRPSSPTPSTATSFSEDYHSTAYGASPNHHNSTVGFANTLSHTIIREQQEDDTRSIGEISVTDEELSLLGPPWAKEGIVHRKHYWETTGKRSKEKSWLQVFVVISQGQLQMFRFDGAGTTRGGKGGGGMGGGDWGTNAQSVGDVSLAHALCSAMPPPGYSKDRPHCFVLTLPGGGTYFFHAGTQDLVGEWVATCNYWSARLSKEPLTGGVSNMEYGWNRVPSPDDDGDEDDREEILSVRSGKSGRSGHSRLSHHTSSSLYGNSNDRVTVNDWRAPAVPTGASTLSEEAQLDNLRRHVTIVRAELATHNALRTAMVKLYSSRSANLAKASANWERKSQYLLSELVKWVTYADNLSSAMRLRALRRGQKEVEEMLEAADEGSPLLPDFVAAGSNAGFEGEKASLLRSSLGEEDEEDGEAQMATVRLERGRPSIDASTINDADEAFFDPETPTRLEA